MHRALISTTLFFLIGCTTNSGLALEEYMETASSYLGENFDLLMVDSSGAIADATFIALSKNKPSKQAVRLAQRIASATKPYGIAVAGDNYSKSAVIVQNALDLMDSDSGLSKSIVCFCSDSYRDQIETGAKRVGIEVHLVVK